jgi:hypothetical protein
MATLILSRCTDSPERHEILIREDFLAPLSFIKENWAIFRRPKLLRLKTYWWLHSTNLASLREWFESTLPKLSRKSDTTAAIRYALTRWGVLHRYCEDGVIEIDNNAAERSLRGGLCTRICRDPHFRLLSEAR